MGFWMDKKEFTRRDKEYLRVLFLLKAHEDPVGPAEVAEKLNVSRVAAMKKLRRLESLGVGRYISKKGLLINDRGVDIVQRDTRKHHLLENFLENTLEMNSEEACRESAALDSSVSTELIEKMKLKYGKNLDCECGCQVEAYYEPEKLYNCHWYQKMFSLN